MIIQHIFTICYAVGITSCLFLMYNKKKALLAQGTRQIIRIIFLSFRKP